MAQILLIEDEPLIRMLAVDMLEVLGHTAIEAGDGAEALALSRDVLDGVSVAIVDLGLPDLPGEEVVRRMRLIRPDLPVIVASGADAAAAIVRMGGDKPVAILEKPYQMRDLERVLDGLVPAV
jgi:CheY-like chemotaxis protein